VGDDTHTDPGFSPGSEAGQALARCQGAWQEIEEGCFEAACLWLRSFVITGKSWYSSDGSVGRLVIQDDGVISMEGGVLIVEDGCNVLRRIGRSGIITRLERFQLPSPESEDQFRGVWLLTDTNAVLRGRWVERIVINGSVWVGNAPECRGFLKVSPDGSVTLCGGNLSLLDDGQLCLTSPSGKVIQYQRIDMISSASRMDPDWTSTAESEGLTFVVPGAGPED
jgi:hypothetical protein